MNERMLEDMIRESFLYAWDQRLGQQKTTQREISSTMTDPLSSTML
jgi:hypothetical protein